MFFLVGGIIVCTYALRIDWILHQSKSWPESEGRVISVMRVGHDRGLTYTYQYVANGKTEISTNIEPGMDSGYYPISEGEEVGVWHTGNDDSYSYLVRPDVKSIILPHVLGFSWMAMGGVGLFALYRRRIESPKLS